MQIHNDLTCFQEMHNLYIFLIKIRLPIINDYAQRHVNDSNIWLTMMVNILIICIGRITIFGNYDDILYLERIIMASLA